MSHPFYSTQPKNPLPLDRGSLIDKSEWIPLFCAGKNVLNLGAAGHPCTEFSATHGRHLHLILSKVAKTISGIDLDRESLDYLTAKHNAIGLVCGNAERLLEYFPEKSFDVVVAGDVIEHVNNMGLLMESSASVLRDGGTMIVTVPNTYGIKRIIAFLLLRTEFCHPDHVCYYSPMNFVQIASRFGFEIVEMKSFMISKENHRRNNLGNRFSAIIQWLFRNHWLADEIAVVLRKR